MTLKTFFSILRKFHVKKSRFTICKNLYGVHNIIANHVSGPFDLKFVHSSRTSVVVAVPWMSQRCIVLGVNFWISVRAGIPRKVRFWCTLFFYVNKHSLNCLRFSYNDHEPTFQIMYVSNMPFYATNWTNWSGFRSEIAYLQSMREKCTFTCKVGRLPWILACLCLYVTHSAGGITFNWPYIVT